ncbi:MAG: ABC transporter ATP-binding protein [Frisingicoccus sp.]
MRTIEVKNGVKCFGEQQVLKGVSIQCESGHIYGIVGHNGSGKTVLFKCICGFMNLDEGEIIVDGTKRSKKGAILTGAGIIIEEPSFLKNASGLRNLDILYRIKHGKDAAHLKNIMEMVGLNPDSKKQVGNYSMGMKQRLAIAQAIMENQEILILDEPMNGLDHKGVEEMRKLFLKLKKEGKLILLASHNRDDIDILCDEVYEMEMGELKKIKNK